MWNSRNRGRTAETADLTWPGCPNPVHTAKELPAGEGRENPSGFWGWAAKLPYLGLGGKAALGEEVGGKEKLEKKTGVDCQGKPLLPSHHCSRTGYPRPKLNQPRIGRAA